MDIIREDQKSLRMIVKYISWEKTRRKVKRTWKEGRWSAITTKKDNENEANLYQF